MLKSRNVWLILMGEFVAGLGLWLGIIGNLEFLQEHVPSDFFKSLILFTGLFAGVVVGPYAGKVIDTNKKKTILLLSGFVRIISVVFMLLALKYSSVMWMVAFMVSIQISGAFYFPALQAAIPLVVEERQLLSMNSIHMNVSTISRILGTALGGALLVWLDLHSLYIGSMAAYALLFFATFLLNIPEDSVLQRNEVRGKASFKEIIPILNKTPVVKTSLILTIVPILFIGSFNLMVINISELQGDNSIKGILYMTEGICFMIGAFLVKRISNKWESVKLILICSTVIAFSQLSLYFAANKIASIISFGIFGIAVGCFFPLVATIFQTKIAREYHGRFFSFRNMFDRVMFQIVLLFTGILLDTIGLQWMVTIFGLTSLTLILYFIFRQHQSFNQPQNTSL